MNKRQRQYRRGLPDPRSGRKRKGALLVAGVLTGIVILAMVYFVVHSWLGQSDFFQITTIRINGCEKVSKREVLEYSGVDIHSNLFALDVAAVKTRVESGPWIRQAKIERHWPNRLDIKVTEHSPVAIVNLEGALHYVDELGNVFAEVISTGDLDYPIITGISGSSPGELHNDKALLEALRFIKYASSGNLNLPVQNISEINVGNLEDAVLFLVDRPFPIHLGAMGKGLKTKYFRLARVLSWLYRQKQYTSTDYIDIGYMSEKILVGQRAQ